MDKHSLQNLCGRRLFVIVLYQIFPYINYAGIYVYIYIYIYTQSRTSYERTNHAAVNIRKW
jgi:hypothetical protein